MEASNPADRIEPAGGARRQGPEPTRFDSRAAIEGYLDRLNSASPLARRDVARWGGDSEPCLELSALVLPSDDDTSPRIFAAEARTSFALDVHARRAAAAGAPYSVGLVLSGSFCVTTSRGEFLARAGQGVIVHPAGVERTQLSPGSHFIEFALPADSLVRLGAELGPGRWSGAPDFVPVLEGATAAQLLGMVRQAAASVCAGRQAIFARWIEIMALTLLDQAQVHRPGRKAEAPVAAPPRSIGRALDFIDAHAPTPILLADVAAAACVSASTLLRQFNQHLGQSPMAFLRQVRLDRARAELRRGCAESIGDLARRWGFQTAGKFSQAYLRRFGERPSDTRRQR